MQLRAFAFLLPLVAGCLFDNGPPPPPQCSGPSAYTIDTGATLGYTVGVDAGYYTSYAAGGHWHFEWTCDTKLSATGCNFTGSITAPPGATVTPYMLEPEDALDVTPSASATVAQFNTITSTGIDGVDVVTTAGAPVTIDWMIDGLYQNDLVFLPSGGQSIAAACMPAQLTPSLP